MNKYSEIITVEKEETISYIAVKGTAFGPIRGLNKIRKHGIPGWKGHKGRHQEWAVKHNAPLKRSKEWA